MKDFNTLYNKITSNSIHKSMYIISKIPLPARIMRTNYETIMGAIRVENYLIKIDKTIKQPRPCPYCYSNVTTVIHHMYRCPLAEWMWHTVRTFTHMQFGLNLDPDDKVIFQATFPLKLWRALSKNIRIILHIITSAARQTLFGLLYVRKHNISTVELLDTFKHDIQSSLRYYNTITTDCKSPRTTIISHMLFSSTKLFTLLKPSITSFEKFQRNDSNYISNEHERRRQDKTYICHRVDLYNRNNPVRFLASLIGGIRDPMSPTHDQMTDADRLEHYITMKRSGYINIDKYNLLLGKAVSHFTVQICA